MNFIENVSMEAIKGALHFDPGPNSMLIQIVDPGHDFPIPKFPFKVIHKFKFWDEEEEVDGSISEGQALAIAKCLRAAKDHHMNVIVHCHAGLCRSGAVAECGIFIGFQDTEVKRIPNLLVKGKIMKQLGFSYEAN